MMELNKDQEFPVTICELLQIIRCELGGYLGHTDRDRVVEHIESKLESIRKDRIYDYNSMLCFCESYR